MINKVILVGRLGKDPEVRHFDNGGKVARFSLATDEAYKDRSGQIQRVTEWHDVSVWGPQAEIAEKYLHKGMLVYVEGKLTRRKYQDKDGIERTAVDVRVNSFKMLERKEGGGSGSSQPSDSGSQVDMDDPFNDSGLADDGLPF